MTSFYVNHYRLLREACFRMLLHGVRYDLAEAQRKAKALTERKDNIKDELDKLSVTWDDKKQKEVSHKLYAEDRHRSPELLKLLEEKRQREVEKKAIPKDKKAERKLALAAVREVASRIKDCRDSGRDVTIARGTGLSDQKIANFLYGTLQLPPHKKKRKDTGKITVTVDDVTLKKIKQGRQSIAPLVDLIIEHRKCNKLLSYLDEEKLDEDGRMRSFYKPYGTQTGRLSSSETPIDTGWNAQNTDRTLKYLLLPDEG